MKSIAGLYIAFVACSIAHAEPQSQSQEFVVKEMNSPKGIVALVYDDKGKEILHGLYHDEKLDRSTDKQERLALYVTSQNSGPGKQIASGGFFIETSRWMGDQYVAFIHCARPDEMKPVKASESPDATRIPASTFAAEASSQFEKILTKEQREALGLSRLSPDQKDTVLRAMLELYEAGFNRGKEEGSKSR